MALYGSGNASKSLGYPKWREGLIKNAQNGVTILANERYSHLNFKEIF
jgi:hypothetical protein